MSVSLLTAQDLLGLFELDDGGKVLYHRMDTAGACPDLTGQNFYDQVARFENVEEFRRCVNDFTSGTKAADSFDFDCRYDSCNHPIRVLLARICDRLDRNHTKSVLVHIREALSAERSGKGIGERG